jgi:adenylate cyclase
MWKFAVENPANLASNRQTERLRLMALASPPIKGGTPWRRRLVAFALWALLVALAQGWGVFDSWEEPVTQLKQALSWPSTYPMEKDVALITIDHIPPDRPWPWPHLDHAVLLRALLNYSPQSVIINLPLYDEDARYRVFDRTLSNVVARFDRIAFCAQALTYRPDNRTPARVPTLPFTGINQAPEFAGAFWPSDSFAREAPVGIDNPLLPPDGQPRSVPLVFNIDDRLLPSISLQAAALRLGADLAKSRVHFGSRIELSGPSGNLLRAIPIDSQGRMQLRLYSKPRPVWRDSFDNAILYSEQALRGERPFRSLSALRQKQVWIGRADKKEINPVWGVSTPTSATELHMRAAANIIAGDFIRPVPTALLALLYIGAASGLLYVSNKLTASQTVSLGLFLIGLWAILGGALFMTMGYLLPLVSYSILVAGGVLLAVALRKPLH